MAISYWTLLFICLHQVICTKAESYADVVCPSDFPCSCHREAGHGKYALDINCRGYLDNGRIPDLSSLRAIPIVRFDLSSNNIRDLPADTFKGLKFIGLSKHPLVDPKLSLSDNILITVDEKAFSGITADILNLAMDNCSLTSVPQLPNFLVSLDLFNNTLTQPPSFHGLTKLKRLNLGKNMLSSLNRDSFAGLENSLTTLDVSETGLRAFPSTALMSLKNIQTIVLNENAIHSLPMDMLKGFQTTSTDITLELKDNRIRRVATNALIRRAGSNMTIINLNLGNNKLSDVDFLYKGCSVVLNYVSVINLRGNPVVCGCEFFYFSKVGYYKQIQGICDRPEEYHNVEFRIYRSNIRTEKRTDFKGEYGKRAERNCKEFDLSKYDYNCLEEGYKTIDIIEPEESISDETSLLKPNYIMLNVMISLIIWR